MVKDEVSLQVNQKLPTVTDEETVLSHNMDGIQSEARCVNPEGGGTKARYANLQPWPDKGCEMSGLGVGHSDKQLPLPTTQSGVYGGENCTKQNLQEDGASLEQINARKLKIYNI